MSNYIQTTLFTPKDSLPANNPAKTIFGAAYDVEFGNIATAIASKYDTTSFSTAFPSGTFTGTVTGMTSATTGTISYHVSNGMCTLLATGNLLGTSNSTGLSLTGLPAVCQPSAGSSITCYTTDNTNANLLSQGVISGSSIIFGLASTATVANRVQLNAALYTNTGTKGLAAGWTLTYPLS